MSDFAIALYRKLNKAAAVKIGFYNKVAPQVVREELQGVEFISGKEQPKQPQEAGDLDDSVLGFLLALQNDGGDEFSPTG